MEEDAEAHVTGERRRVSGREEVILEAALVHVLVDDAAYLRARAQQKNDIGVMQPAQKRHLH